MQIYGIGSVMLVKMSLALIAVATPLAWTTAFGQRCPTSPIERPSAVDQAFVDQTGLQVDLDGAANAYHITGDRGPNAGIEYVCSGVDIYNVRDNALHTMSRGPECHQTYSKLRDLGFPACAEGGSCIRFYGIVSTERACGFKPRVTDRSCGVPIRQRDPQGNQTGFFVSSTAWTRPDGRWDDQATYLDARYVPYLVYNAGKLKALGIKKGDLAAVSWKGHASFAIFGDVGDHLSEASIALLNRLHGQRDVERPNWDNLSIREGAVVIAFRNSAQLLDRNFPVSISSDRSKTPGRQIAEAGKAALLQVGPKVSACLGTDPRVFSRD